jgi:hypothetical protein
MARLVPELGPAMPFRRAVRILGFPAPGIQPVTVWAKIGGAGEQAMQDVETLCKAVFEGGVVPWRGIGALPEEDRLEAIEGQVRHTLYLAQMKNGSGRAGTRLVQNG